jgi:hypothetical protein
LKGETEMKKEERPEQTIVVNINLTRCMMALLALALLTMAFLGYLAWGHEEVAASSPQAPVAAATGMRQYYLTKAAYNGNEPTGAGVCASGYHFASLWEILDPSNLEYNTDLGRARDDSGSGPPTYDGWVRTGYSSNNGTTAGQANCNSWSTTAGYGTRARMTSDWTGTKHLHVWFVGTMGCSSTRYVWCVED